jgi:hypothetical protein
MEQLEGGTTSAIFRNPETGEWTPKRATLHESIIDALLAGKRQKKNPKLWVVMGGVGSGKSRLIASELEPSRPGAVVIDADRLWLRIPEYEELAGANWRTAGELTYAEVRHLRDAVLAEAAVRRLDIILEISGDENSEKAVSILEQDGYEVAVEYIDCSPEEAHERIRHRANTNPTPEDNLWCSPVNPEYPDKYDYQNLDLNTFRDEYERRRQLGSESDEIESRSSLPSRIHHRAKYRPAGIRITGILRTPWLGASGVSRFRPKWSRTGSPGIACPSE